MMLARYLAALAVALVAGPVTAAESAVPASPGFSTLLQVLLGLGVVMAAIAAAAWLARRYVPGVASGGPVRVVGGAMVGPKERVVVLEIEDDWIVVGVTATQVNALHALPRPRELAAVSGVSPADAGAGVGVSPPSQQSQAGALVAKWLGNRRRR
jgi:flagellar protein FliO/FliZ